MQRYKIIMKSCRHIVGTFWEFLYFYEMQPKLLIHLIYWYSIVCNLLKFQEICIWGFESHRAPNLKKSCKIHLQDFFMILLETLRLTMAQSKIRGVSINLTIGSHTDDRTLRWTFFAKFTAVFRTVYLLPKKFYREELRVFHSKTATFWIENCECLP